MSFYNAKQNFVLQVSFMETVTNLKLSEIHSPKTNFSFMTSSKAFCKSVLAQPLAIFDGAVRVEKRKIMQKLPPLNQLKCLRETGQMTFTQFDSIKDLSQIFTFYIKYL